jgi:hypothetical protein
VYYGISNIRGINMEENIKDIGGQGEDNLIPLSNDKHTFGRASMAGAVVAGAIGGALATGGDVSAQTEYMDRQANIPPKTEMITGEGFNNPAIEEVKTENLPNVWGSFADVGTLDKEGEFDGEVISPEDPRYLNFLRDAVESQGQILIESPSVPFEVVGEKGATDRYGNYYENVINKINIAGNEIEIVAGGYFDEMTFLFDYDEDKLGKMLAIYWLEDKDFGKSFDASPYLEGLRGNNEIYIDSRDKGKASYGIIMAIGTSGSRGITPPVLYLDSKGEPRLMGSSPDGFNVVPSGFVGSNRGWIHSVLFKGFVQPDGKQVIELLGVINGSKVIVLPEKLDSKSAELLNKS